MATVYTTLGSHTENVDISSVAGPVGGVYTVTLASPPTADTVIGDTLTDEADPAKSFLITGISGSDLEVKDVFGAGVAPSAAAASVATTKRTYADLAAFNTALNDTSIYAANDLAHLWVCERITLTGLASISNGATIGLSKINIWGHTNYRHSGSVGDATIAGFIYTGSDAALGLLARTTTIECDFAWLVIASLPSATWNRASGIQQGAAGTLRVHHCLIYNNSLDVANSGQTLAGIWVTSGAPGPMHISNNVIWGFKCATAGQGRGIEFGSATSGSCSAKNNTVYDCHVRGISSVNSGQVLRNNVVLGSGTIDYVGVSWGATSSNNAASDTSAPGGSSIQSQVVADTFVDAAGGDLHLKPTANARTAGANLTGEGDDIETDIDGETRPASPTAWDIGADYYVAAALTGVPIVDTPFLLN